MEFTLPLRPASSKRWGLRASASESSSTSASDLEVDSEPGPHKPGNAPSLLAPLATSKVTKPGQNQAMVKSSLRTKSSRLQLTQGSSFRTKPSRLQLTQGSSFETALIQAVAGELVGTQNQELSEDVEKDWAILNEHVRNNPNVEKEIGLSLTTLTMRQSKQSAFRVANTASGGDPAETDENVVKILKPEDLPANIRLHVSFRSAHTLSYLATSFMVLVNELPDFTAFSAELQVEFGNMHGVELLRSMQLTQWLFRSSIIKQEVDNPSPSDNEEYYKSCAPEAAEELYKEFWDFLTRRGRINAKKDVRAAKERLDYVRRTRKGRALYTADGLERKFPEVRVPGAVDLHGYVDVFF